MDLDQLEYLMVECLIHNDNYPELENKEKSWLNLIKCEEYWSQIFRLSLDSYQSKEYFMSLTDEERLHYFKFGVSCCLHFIQANFTGPELPQDIQDFLSSDLFKDIDFAKRLSVNREDINSNTKYPALLVCSEVVFDCCVVHHLVNLWWGLRVMRIHQEVLDELSPTILSNADQFYKLIMDSDVFQGHVKAKLDIELSHFYLIYRNFFKVKKHITSASEILGVELKLIKNNVTGKNHLEVNVTEKEGIQRPEVEDMKIPKILDDGDEQLETVTILPNTEQKLCLAITEEIFTSIPSDELQVKNLQPFLDLIINQKNTYTVKIAALLLRCKVESKPKIIVERCVKQFENIIECFNETEPHPLQRIKDYFGAAIPPIWKVKKLLAGTLLNMGLLQESLDIYWKIQVWEELIICYNLLENTQKAIDLINEQLEIDPTSVRFMCLKGDATQDTAYYEKAWEMSKKRSHRVQRHWGQYLFKLKEYEDCLPHFEKSLSINPYQYNIWLRLGFAALQSENWQIAATAYRRYTNLAPAAYKAWNNLAQAYVKIDNKLGAHYAITEALKHKSDCWKIWENSLVINCDILQFDDAIEAYNNILNLKEKYLNVEILNILVYNVCNEKNDSEEDDDDNDEDKDGNNHDSDSNSSRKLMQKTQILIGRIISNYPSDGYVWEIYASLAPVTLLRAQRLQRAFRGYTQNDWDKDVDTCHQVLYVCIKLADIVLNDEIDARDVIVSSVKLNISSALTSIRKHDYEETKTLLEKLSSKYEKLLEKIKISES